MLFQNSTIMFPLLLSRPRTAMSILLPATEESTFRRRPVKMITIVMVPTLPDTLHGINKLTLVISELCYLLRYPARHGRKSGYPFSLRQTAVYQRFDDVRKTSKWIFVQAPDDFSNELRNSLSSGNQERSPRDIHRCAFALAEQEWRDYICYLDAELRVLVRCGPGNQ